MVTYHELGARRQLNEIVIAGTHDAGITRGGSGVQTQTLNIGEQAKAGVRFFDLRIAAAVTSQSHPTSGRPVAELRAFHADDKVVMHLNRKVILAGTDNKVKLEQSKLGGGAFGLALSEMLRQARNFVNSTEGKEEFLILKFDKCTNWGLIAEACRQILGWTLYTDGGNLNTRTLGELRGKVIVLFSQKGWDELQGNTQGILRFKNLSGEGATYQPVYDGLQYYGKGGTSPFNPFDKLKQNIKKQTKLVLGGSALRDPAVIGMMYWTTTGLFESIQKRDDGMWDSPNVMKMKAVWGQGLADFVNARTTLPSTNNLAQAQQRRSFFPNIVMIDFADDTKCGIIRGLNDLSASHLAALA
jgi:hypothetical protein